MSLSNVYSVGLNNVGSYQVSGMPFATSSFSSPIQFPYVTSWVKIVNNDASDISVGFSENGVSSNNDFIVKSGSTTEPLFLKLSELYFSSTTNVSVVAGLTNIPIERINGLSGSGDIAGNNWSGSVGVG